MSYQKRVEKAQSLLKKSNIDAVIVTSPSNFFYFSGTWLDSHERLQAILISQSGRPAMIVHEMSKEEVEKDGLFDQYFWKDGDVSLELLAKVLPDIGTIAIDNLWPSQNLLRLMQLKNGLAFIESTKIVSTLRLYKDQHEIKLLKESGAIADRVMEQVIEFIKPGLSEKDVVDEIKRLFALENVNRLSFDPIVGAGKNGAIPHHQSDNTVIQAGDMVVVDMGGIKNNYCSDMTRTVFVGTEPNEEMKEVYEIVRKAKDAAIKAVKPGVPLKVIDQTARDIISKAGYGINFTHRTGHGLGIDVHEEPFVTSNNHELLEDGMVISIEPGIYLEGKFGVRIEDIIVVTANGCDSFNHFTCEFLDTGIVKAKNG